VKSFQREESLLFSTCGFSESGAHRGELRVDVIRTESRETVERRAEMMRGERSWAEDEEKDAL